MVNKKIQIEQLPDMINSILKEYEGDVIRNIPEITDKIGKAGVKTLRNSAKNTFGGSGKYARGWRSQTVKTRMGATVTIYNGRLPGLPHLLEHGHANRNGGRTEGRAHIAPVETKLIKEYERKVINDITRGR